MKIEIFELEFNRDPEFDATVSQHVWFVTKYKKHWWNRWHYIMDGFTNCPMLFKTKDDAFRAGLESMGVCDKNVDQDRIDALIRDLEEYDSNCIHTRYHSDGEGEEL